MGSFRSSSGRIVRGRARNPSQLSRNAPVAEPLPGIEATAELSGVEQDLLNQLEHFAFEDIWGSRAQPSLGPGLVFGGESGWCDDVGGTMLQAAV
jgi:hypothetical protein